MRTIRVLGRTLGLLAVLLAATTARADDTKPPNFSDVKAALKGNNVVIEAKITDDTGVLNAACFHRKPGGKWEETPMTKNDYDDNFKVTFAGGGDTEYYLQATDILGNGPSAYGQQNKPMAVGGKAGKGAKQELARADPPPEPSEEPRAPREPKVKHQRPPPPPEDRPRHEPPPAKVASRMAPPQITHRKPSVSPPEGQELVLRVKISSEAGVATAAVYARPGDHSKTISIPLVSKGDDQYTATIPGAVAKGVVEYLLAAIDKAKQQTNQGDGSAETWFRLEFKAAGGKPADSGSQGFLVASGSLSRAEPRKPIVLRAQVSPGNLADLTEASAAEAETAVQGIKVRVLWREKDGEDQESQMQPDPTGGLGGYGAQLPPQFDGTVIYYQVVACSADGSRCAIDTGSKKKWNPLLVSDAPGEALPPLDAASTKAPAGLPE